MKQIYPTKIINLPNTSQDDLFCFLVPKNSHCIHTVDMRELLAAHKNNTLDYSRDPKLWSEVYPPKKELELFIELVEKALKEKKKIHIENISLAEEFEYIEKLYQELGYFDEGLNAFVVDFKNCPITVGVNIRNFAYSFKDYYILGEKAFFIPPPREPLHQKAIRSALNSGLISTIHLNEEDSLSEKTIITTLLQGEKTNLLKLGQVLYFNLQSIGYEMESSEWIIQL